MGEQFKDDRFSFEKKFDAVKELQKIFIPKAFAPTIVPKINSDSFHNDQDLMANNKFQKFIMEGKFANKWGRVMEKDQLKNFDGIIPRGESLTKI